MNIREELKEKECCGCSSCMQKCPQNAIKMTENYEGFLYPKIDKEKCTNCGMCIKVCPQLKEINANDLNNSKAYAMYNKDIKIQKQSSSGGVFSAISKFVIENGGVVFGAAFDKELNVQHIKVDNINDLELLRTSKYVQSNINNMYKEAEEELQNKKIVLFSGTPCQVEGLKSYLIKEYDNLITTDFVCHGVPSQKLFNKYIMYLSEKYKSKVIKYNFRNKEKKGWSLVSKIETEDGKVRYVEPGFDPYYSNFLHATIYRESCYTCHYANLKRVSDITLADYFAITKIHPSFFNENGISLILINTKKGKWIMNKIINDIKYIETDLEFASKHNENLIKPSKRTVIRDYIYKEIEQNNYITNNLKVKNSLKKTLQRIIPINIRKKMKNFLIKNKLKNKKKN